MPLSTLADPVYGVRLVPGQAAPFRGIRFLSSDAQVEADFPHGAGYGIRGTVLHQLLIDRATERGVCLRWGTRINGLSAEGAAIGEQQMRCRWLLCADEHNPVVRRLADLDFPHSALRRFGFRRHHKVAPWTDFVEAHWSGQRLRTGLLALLAWLVLLPSIAAVQRITVDLDPAQTRIEWTLGDVLHTVHGTFKLRSGSVTFDSKSGDASGEIIVDATSGESGNHTRDQKMHKEILESQRYPEITFSPAHVTGKIADQGTSSIQVQGMFLIHGAGHNITLSLPVEKSGNEVKASTSFDVPYQEWGMKNPSTFLLKVDNKVKISVSAVGHITAPGTVSAYTRTQKRTLFTSD